MASLTPDSLADVGGSPESLTVRIQEALVARHPVTLLPQRARNYAELAAFVAQGGSVNNYDEMQDQIVRGAKYLHDAVGRTGRLYVNAGDAGAKLAAEVYRFTQDPEAVGTDALEAAYGEFMGQHSGGFTDSVREAAEARA